MTSRVGRVEAPVPMTSSGELTLELKLIADDPVDGPIDVVTRDSSRIEPA